MNNFRASTNESPEISALAKLGVFGQDDTLASTSQTIIHSYSMTQPSLRNFLMDMDPKEVREVWTYQHDCINNVPNTMIDCLV